MGFDINRHKNYESADIEKAINLYAMEIQNNEYVTMEDIQEKLDFKVQYLQKRINKFETLYIDIDTKNAIYFYFQLPKELIPYAVFEALYTLKKNSRLLRKRVLVKKESVINYMCQNFKIEIWEKDEEGKPHLVGYRDISREDAEEYWRCKVYATVKAKELLNCKHNTQLSRKLAKISNKKIVLFEDGKATKNVRYYFLNKSDEEENENI